jgi:hypothetical protein
MEKITCCVCLRKMQDGELWFVVSDKNIFTLKSWRNRTEVTKPICGSKCACYLINEKMKSHMESLP